MYYEIRRAEACLDDDDAFYLFLQKLQIAYRHIPIGYPRERQKKAGVMMLPSCQSDHHTLVNAGERDIV
jgi:hypothetical protein